MSARKRNMLISPTLIGLLCLINLPLVAFGEIKAAPTKLSEQEKQFAEWVGSHQGAMLKDLETYVNVNTGTLNRAGLNRFRGC